MGQFNVEILKKFIGPEIDAKPDVTLSDLTPEFESAEHWYSHYFLSSVFHGEFAEPTRFYAESYIARAHFVFNGYTSARLKTIEYADKWRIGAPGINRYLSAIGEWESVFLNSQMIYDILAKWLGATITGRENRSRLIANRIKHVSEDIKVGKLSGPGLPLWLTKNGFATVEAKVTFEEMEGQVRLFAKVAECLSAPTEAKKRFAEIDASLAEDPNYNLVP